MRGPVSLRSMLIGVCSLCLQNSVRLYSTPLSRAKVCQEVGIRLGPEPRHVPNAHPAVLDRRSFSVGHVGEIAEETLQRALLLLGGEDVQRREVPRAEVGRMGHAGGA